MVEESNLSSNKTKTKTARPKAVHLWTEADVQKWLRRHCSDYYNLYWERFHEHDITGRALVRINDNTLLEWVLRTRSTEIQSGGNPQTETES